MDDKPYAPACDRNRDPILAVLREHLGEAGDLLEVGSGTGQHAVHFAAALPGWRWQCSGCSAGELAGIRLWLRDAGLANTPAPLIFDVNQPEPPGANWNAVFTSNTLHIMAWTEVERLFRHLPALLADDALFIVYGPFKYAGKHTSPSNAEFDFWLRSRDPQQGVRDFEKVGVLADEAGLSLVKDHPMPANNRCLIWRRTR